MAILLVLILLLQICFFGYLSAASLVTSSIYSNCTSLNSIEVSMNAIQNNYLGFADCDSGGNLQFFSFNSSTPSVFNKAAITGNTIQNGTTRYLTLYNQYLNSFIVFSNYYAFSGVAIAYNYLQFNGANFASNSLQSSQFPSNVYDSGNIAYLVDALNPTADNIAIIHTVETYTNQTSVRHYFFFLNTATNVVTTYTRIRSYIDQSTSNYPYNGVSKIFRLPSSPTVFLFYLNSWNAPNSFYCIFFILMDYSKSPVVYQIRNLDFVADKTNSLSNSFLISIDPSTSMFAAIRSVIISPNANPTKNTLYFFTISTSSFAITMVNKINYVQCGVGPYTIIKNFFPIIVLACGNQIDTYNYVGGSLNLIRTYSISGSDTLSDIYFSPDLSLSYGVFYKPNGAHYISQILSCLLYSGPNNSCSLGWCPPPSSLYYYQSTFVCCNNNFFDNLVGNCTLICSGNQVGFQSQCVPSCPSLYSFIDNDLKVCMGSCGTKYVLNQKCYSNCPTGYYNLAYNNNFLCVNNCGTASNSTLTLIDNDTNSCVVSCGKKNLYNGTCYTNCPSNVPFSNNNQCVSSCTSYVNGTTCVSNCPNVYRYDNKTCLNDCKGMFLYQGACYPNCNLTITAITAFNGTCYVNCPNGMYNYNFTCYSSCPTTPVMTYSFIDYKCYSNCSSITGQKAFLFGTSCITNCPTGFYLHNNTCVTTCPSSLIQVGTNCVNCNTGTPFIFQNQCFATCPVNTYRQSDNSTLCVSTCPKYISNNICVSTCPVFTAGNFCVNSCPSNSSFLNGTNCLTSCPPATFNFNNTCVSSCPTNITSLITNSINKTCDDCSLKNKFNYNNNTCVNDCPAGFIKDQVTKSCFTCGAKIFYNQTCVGSCPNTTYFNKTLNSCVRCSNDTFLYNGQCMIKCPSTAINVDRICINCPDSGQYFYNNTCYSACPPNTTSTSNGNCVSQKMDLCAPDTCLNNGTCSLVNNKISCKCTSGYSGSNCEVSNSQVKNLVSSLNFDTNSTNITLSPTQINSLVTLSNVISPTTTSSSSSSTSSSAPLIDNNSKQAITNVILNIDVTTGNPNQTLKLFSMAVDMTKTNTDLPETSKSSYITSITNSVNNLVSNLVSTSNNTNLTTITPSIGFQISSTTPESINDTQRLAQINNLSMLNFEECQSKLMSFYNIPQNMSLIFSKVDLGTGSDSPSMSFKVFNPIDKTLLNLSVCDGSSVKIAIPTSPSILNISLMKDFSNYGINISDESHPFFNNICPDYDPVIQAITNSLSFLTLQGRKNKFFQNNIPKCMIGSTLCNITLDKDNYTSCNCPQNSTSGQSSILKFEKIFTNTIINSNYKVLFCLDRLKDFPSSSMFFAIGGVTTMFLALSVISFLMKNKLIEKNLENIRRNEKFFNIKENVKKDIEKREPEKEQKPSVSGKPKLSIIDNQLLINHPIKNLNPKKSIFETLEKTGRKMKNNSIFKSPFSINQSNDNFQAKIKSIDKIDCSDLSILEIESLSIKGQLKYDKRGFLEYFRDCLILDNLILRTFFLKSIFLPPFLRFLIFQNTIIVNLITICLLYNLALLDDLSSLTREEIIFMTISSAAWSVIISSFNNLVLGLFLYVPLNCKNLINKSIVTRNPSIVIESYSNFLTHMKYRYFAFFFFSFVLYIIGTYYVIVFLIVYNNISWDILTKLGVSFLVNFCLGTIIPLLVTIVRTITYKLPRYRFIMNIKVIECWIAR